MNCKTAVPGTWVYGWKEKEKENEKPFDQKEPYCFFPRYIRELDWISIHGMWYTVVFNHRIISGHKRERERELLIYQSRFANGAKKTFEILHKKATNKTTFSCQSIQHIYIRDTKSLLVFRSKRNITWVVSHFTRLVKCQLI